MIQIYPLWQSNIPSCINIIFLALSHVAILYLLSSTLTQPSSPWFLTLSFYLFPRYARSAQQVKASSSELGNALVKHGSLSYGDTLPLVVGSVLVYVKIIKIRLYFVSD